MQRYKFIKHRSWFILTKEIFSVLVSLNGPKRNYHINYTNSNMLKDLKIFHNSKLIKINFMLKRGPWLKHIHGQKQSIFISKFLKLAHKA